MNGESLNIQQDNTEKLKQLFPELFSENKLDWEKLKAAFSDDINFANERYVLNWAGKADAFKALQIPTTATLKPVPEESVNFDTTQNVFIEGENLEVLKVLQKSYYNKVKCIIIDPPYNTGSDSFIYPDRFKENKTDYEKRVGYKNEEGYLLKEGLFRKNSKDSGHYHSNWLSMMYPRLFLAKNLLKDDGVIFINIDENEIHNLRLLGNEIFGEENYAGEIIWKNSSKNDQSYISIQHEYILCFVKSKTTNVGNWEEKKEGLEEIYQAFNLFKKKHGDNWEAIHKEAVAWYKKFPASNSISNSKHYNWMDNKGVYFPADISGPNFGQYRYDVLHPITGNICKEPASGWRFPKETMKQRVKEGLVHFGKDETTVPNNKTYLKDTEYQSLTSVKYRDGRVASKLLNNLLDGNYFNNPKDTDLIEDLLKALKINDSDIVLDFFAGSGTTAQAVLELNKEDGGSRKFILVQLPELTDENSEAYKAGFKTIADISKERVRRVITKIQTETTSEEKKKEGELNLGGKNSMPASIDLGFKAFEIAPSNFKIWRGNEINEENLVQQLDAFTNPVNESSQEQNLLYELMIKAGYKLTDQVEEKEKYYFVCNGELIIALTEINQTVIDKILSDKPKKVIALDKLFAGNDQLKTNAVLQMRDAGVEFKTI